MSNKSNKLISINLYQLIHSFLLFCFFYLIRNYLLSILMLLFQSISSSNAFFISLLEHFNHFFCWNTIQLSPNFPISSFNASSEIVKLSFFCNFFQHQSCSNIFSDVSQKFSLKLFFCCSHIFAINI